MADDEAEKSGAAATRSAEGAAQEAEVYGALGSLLGVLEVITTDDSLNIAEPQAARIRSALSYGQRVQQYVEALLTLSSDDLRERLRPTLSKLRPLLEHALRGALRGGGTELSLRWPEDAKWGSELVNIDVSRVDRAINALASELVGRLGGRGVIAVEVNEGDDFVRVRLSGEPADSSKLGPRHSPLLERAANKLLALHGGEVTREESQLVIVASLPSAR